MGSAPTAPAQSPFESWLIPVFVVGAFLCVAVIAFLNLFFTYGCSCGKRSNSVSGSEEARVSTRSVLRKEHPGMAQTHVRRTIVIIPQSECPTAHEHHPTVHEQYQDLQRQYIYQEDTYIPKQAWSAPLHFQAQPPRYQRDQPVYQQPIYQQTYSKPIPTTMTSSSSESVHLAYDESSEPSSSGTSFFHSDSSIPTVFSQSSGSYYHLGNSYDQSSETSHIEVPSLKFTPPSVKDLSARATSPVHSLDYMLQPPELDRFGRAVRQKKVEVEPVAQPRPRTTRKQHRPTGILEGDFLVPENVSANVLRDVQGKRDKVEIKKRRRIGGVYEGKENVPPTSPPMKTSIKRNSFMVKVTVPSTNDLWKFWVTRYETLEQFTSRVAEKLGFEVVLFMEEEMIATDEDWRIISGGSNITAVAL